MRVLCCNPFSLNIVLKVGAVCVGFDEHFNMNKVAQAMQYLQDKSIPYIATNMDATFPMGGGLFAPGKFVLYYFWKLFETETCYVKVFVVRFLSIVTIK